MGGSPGLGARPGPGFGHLQHFAPHGFNRRIEAGRFGFDRFGPNRFDRFGSNRFNRFGRNQFFVGGGWATARRSSSISASIQVQATPAGP
jgi:hypothetical protein